MRFFEKTNNLPTNVQQLLVSILSALLLVYRPFSPMWIQYNDRYLLLFLPHKVTMFAVANGIRY